MRKSKEIKDHESILVLTDQNFRQTTKSGLFLVDFFATWCMPCELMRPTLNELAIEAEDKVTIAKLDVDDCEITAMKFGIRSIPTMILFKDGIEYKRIVGGQSKTFLLKEIETACLS